MNNNDEILITNQDNVETIVEKTTSTIENKIEQPRFNNRAERRKFAKKLGKTGRADMGTISETAKKLTYINLIEKLRELNEKEKTNEDITENN